MNLNGTVSMHDIEDVEAFVRGTIRRHARQIPAEDMEEMVSEGLAILCNLNARYDPERDRDAKIAARSSGTVHTCVSSRCCVPSFAGYASFILPKKLKEVWYSRQPEWSTTLVDGKREYVRFADTVYIEDRRITHDYGDGVGHTLDVIDKTNTRHVGDFIPVPTIPREEAA